MGTGNESEVGEGIKASGVPRESFFLTTKLNNTDHRKPEEALESSLKKLETTYLDLCAFLELPCLQSMSMSADRN